MMSNAQSAKDLVGLAVSLACIAMGIGGCSASPSAAGPDTGAGNSGGMSGGRGGSAGSGAQPSGGSMGRASTGSSALPCDVDKVVQRNCQSCHAAQPLSGVPMALVTLEDFQQPAVSKPDLQVHRLVNMRVHDAAAPMPPAPQKLSGEDKAALERWLAVGAPAGSSCPSGGGTGGSGGSGPIDPPPDQGECFELLAHAPSSKSAPYAVNNEHYVNFYFDAPWPADAQGISFESVFDAHPEIVHHWLLYVVGSSFFPPPQADGTVEPNANGSHAGASLVAGWAPGGNNGLNLPPDVGLDINGGSRKLVMEIHYFANSSLTSRSGVRVCTTKAPRPNLATMSWLGTESISIAPHAQGTASGRCAPSTTQQIHILRSWPHMHRLGTHMKTVINRAGGGSEILVDEPFNFNTQTSYQVPAIIKPGDTLTTTCTYQNDTVGTVRQGTRTSDEMCFNFVTAWPANLLQHGTAMNGSANPCMN